jgi:hypothetical protein
VWLVCFAGRRRLSPELRQRRVVQPPTEVVDNSGWKASGRGFGLRGAWETGSGELEMATAEESLRMQVDQLSEEEAQVVLSLITAKVSERAAETTPALSREVARERLEGKPAFRVPPAGTPPFRRRKRLHTPGTSASEMLIADRR